MDSHILILLEAARSGQSSNWKAVAEHIPGRTNKDCRKRWIKIKTSTTKGTWDPTEDARLRNAVGKHGFRWVEVARDVGTRNSDQCAKRWNYAVDPSIDRSVWKPVEDAALIFAVSKYGPAWRVISEEYFPRRATTDIKNRYGA
ncbi:Homeodomain-like protein [Macrophomina phaseolina]|uniref:Homeodomain-like protein n=1 Tax=Macrophomina phaseolina TaxID=35725 RepID=A0ABQ8GEB3_9PEZI|nr:Homeodomain-like protein [Macrophomina phaseolina]